MKQTYVLDVMVENLIIIELKAMEGILPVHEAQLLTYMKLLQKPKGILINFNCTKIFKVGQRLWLINSIRHFRNSFKSMCVYLPMYL